MWHREGRRDGGKGESVEGLKESPFRGGLGELVGVYVGQQHSKQRGQKVQVSLGSVGGQKG